MNDEWEALARAQWADPLNVITWDELNEKAERDEADYREVRDYALAAAGRGIRAGFRRSGQGVAGGESEIEWELWAGVVVKDAFGNWETSVWDDIDEAQKAFPEAEYAVMERKVTPWVPVE